MTRTTKGEKTTETLNSNLIVAENLKAFIEHTGRSHSWFIKNTGIASATYYKMLDGTGRIENHLDKILKLFNIDDPFYFHKKDFKLPVPKKKNKDITKLAAANYEHVPGEEKEFETTLNMLNDFVNLIELMEKVNNVNVKNDVVPF